MTAILVTIFLLVIITMLVRWVLNRADKALDARTVRSLLHNAKMNELDAVDEELQTLLKEYVASRPKRTAS